MGIVKSVFITILSAIFGIIWSPLVAVILVSCWIHSWVTWRMLRPLNLEKMQGMDACFAHFPQMNIMKAFILSGVPEMQVIRSKLEKVVQDRDENGNLRFRKLSQIMEKHYGLWYWKTAASLQLDDHIQLYNGAAPCNENELKMVLATLQMAPLRCDIPEWQITLIPLQGDFLSYRMQSIVAFRFHHSIADGYTFSKFITSQVEDEHVEYEPKNLLGNKKNRSKLRKLFMVAYACCSCFRMWLTGKIAEQNLLHGPKLNNKDYLTWAVYNMSIVKDVKNATKTTLSDVLLSCLSGAIRKYFIFKNCKIPSYISCYVPMGRYKPKTEYKLENRILSIKLCIPMKIDDPVGRLTATKLEFDEIKSSPDITVHKLAVQFIIPHVPKMILDFLILPSKSISVGTSSIVGPDEYKIFGQDIIVTELFQPHHEDLGINIVFHGQMDKLCVGLNADTAIIKCQEDLDMIMTYFTNELEELHKKVIQGPTPKIQIPYSELNNQCPLSIVIGH